MIFTSEQSQNIYDALYDWLAVYTPGSRYSKERLKKYQRMVWDPVIQAVNRIENQSSQNEEEREFLAITLYSGPIYRIQNFNPRSKGYIYENNYYQSWSKSINGISSVTNFSGMILLIVGTAEQGIDVFGLLRYLNKYEYECFTKADQWHKPESLYRYGKEEEISCLIVISGLTSVVSINRNQLFDWEKCGNKIPEDKWRKL